MSGKSSKSAVRFLDLQSHIGDNKAKIVVHPPSKEKKASGMVPTGLIKWIDQNGNEADFRMTGPPCSTFRLVDGSGTVKYPKLGMKMVSEEQLQPDVLSGLARFAQERAKFVKFIRSVEALFEQIVRERYQEFFPSTLDPKRIEVVSSLKKPNNPDYPALIFYGKLDVSAEAGPNKQNMDPEHIHLRIRHDQEDLSIRDMADEDVYLPVIDSAYPYFRKSGECGLQFKCSSLVVLHKAPAKDEDNFDSIIARYKDDAPPVAAEPMMAAVGAAIKHTLEETVFGSSSSEPAVPLPPSKKIKTAPST